MTPLAQLRAPHHTVLNSASVGLMGDGRGEHVLEFQLGSRIALLSTEDYRGREWSGIILVGLFDTEWRCLVTRRYSSLTKAIDAIHRRAEAVTAEVRS